MFVSWRFVEPSGKGASVGGIISTGVSGVSVDMRMLESAGATISGTTTDTQTERLSCTGSDTAISPILSSGTTHTCSDSSVFERTTSSD